MKREHPNLYHQLLDPAAAGSSSSTGYSAMADNSSFHQVKGEFWEDEEAAKADGGMDELLAVLGYKVRSSEMAEVAQKLEQLDKVMGNIVEEDGFSHLASDTVHYNPSDLSTWLESMLSELNPSPNFDPILVDSSHHQQQRHQSSSVDDSFFAPRLLSLEVESSSVTSINLKKNQIHHLPHAQSNTNNHHSNNDRAVAYEESSSSDYDLKAIPGKAIFAQTHVDSTASSSSSSSSSRSPKRLKPSTANTYPSAVAASSSSSGGGSFNGSTESTATRSVVLVDSQENGIRLVHLLMACAEAVQENNLTLAEALVKQIGFLAVSQAGAMGKVATYFAEALARRIYRLYPQSQIDHSLFDILQMHFYETCPYLKFAHFTANQAILEAFEGKQRVHVIDFSINQGMQWPALLQALALRPGGPPVFRLTGIGPPSHHKSDHLQEVGWKLAQLAETIHVKFEYRGFVVNSLADLDASVLELRPSEFDSVAVNSVFELHKLLARPGALDKVLSVVKQMEPEIVTIVEQEANHNGPVFLDRFTESLHYYSTLFDSLEGSASTQDKVMSEVYLGKQICNIVACEGADRVERHETLTQWRTRVGSAGFVPILLGSNAHKQASMLLALYAGGDGYRVEENNGCLTLGWHTRPLIATSAWRPTG